MRGPTVYWIEYPPHRLGIMARPRGGDAMEDEIRSLHKQGVDVLVSLLSGPERDELELQEEAAMSEQARITFIWFPITDRGLPDREEPFCSLIQDLTRLLLTGRSVVIHCRVGIGRSGLLAGCIGVRLGLSAREAVARIGQARGCPVPDTDEQLEWIMSYERDRDDI